MLATKTYFDDYCAGRYKSSFGLPSEICKSGVHVIKAADIDTPEAKQLLSKATNDLEGFGVFVSFR